jgi:hypothetical protein
MRKIVTVVGMALIIFSHWQSDGAVPETQVTVQVKDEQGQPVQGAHAQISFTAPDGKGATTSVSRTGRTASNGEFTAREKTLSYLSCSARKEGYYSTGATYEFRPTLAAHYEPANPMILLVLKQIINPIQMYARKARIDLPVTDQPAGFDLVAFDWVSPYGNGRNSDLIFTLSRQFNSRTDFRSALTIKFTNDSDGIQPVFADGQYGSALRLPRSASEGPYENSWSRENSAVSPMKIRKDQNYFYRVRTIREDGKIKSALYGKIYGEIQFDVINSKNAIIMFTYYMNPTPNDRNIEFDPKRNLFTNLKPEERVTEP